MRIRPLLLSSAATLTLFMSGGAFVPYALAQKGGTLESSSDWVVTKVAGKTGYSDSYCALAKRFNHDAILTIARNQGTENSLAVDFQKPSFDIAETFAVTLDPGAGEQRLYKVKPASDKAIVIKLGQDAPFFGALEKTGFLRVRVNQDIYNFNLADIDKGQERLDSCLANLVAPAAGGANDSVFPGDSYRVEINALRRQVEELQKKNKDLYSAESRSDAPLPVQSSGAISDLTARVQALEAENKNLQLKAAMAASANAPSVDKAPLEALRAENLKLRMELQTLAPNVSKIEALQKELLALRAKNQTMEGEIQSRSTQESMAISAAPLVETSPKLAELQAENDRLKKALSAAASDQNTAAGLEGDLASLQVQNQQLTQKIEQVKAEAQSRFNVAVQKYKDENESLKLSLSEKGAAAEFVETLQQQVDQLKIENTALKQSATQMRASIEKEKSAEIETAKGEQEEKLSILNKTVKALQAENEAQSKKLLEAAELAVRLKDAESRNAALEQKTISGRPDAAVLAQLHEKLDGLQAEKDVLLQKLKESEAQGQRQAEKQIASLNSENEELKVALAQAKANRDLNQDRGDALKEALEEAALLKQKFDVALQDSKTLKERLAVQDKELEELKAKGVEDVSFLKAENERLRGQVADLGAAGADFDAKANENFVAVEKKNAALQIALANALAAADSAQKDAQEKAQALSNLEQENASLKAQLESKGREFADVAALNAELETLRKENAGLKARVSVLEGTEAQLVTLQGTVQTLDAKNKSLQAEIADARMASNTEAPSSVSMASHEGELTAKIAALEERLRQADTDKQMAMQRLALEYIQLKNRSRSGSAPVQKASVSSEALQSAEEERIIWDDIMPMSGAAAQNEAPVRLESAARLESEKNMDERLTEAQQLEAGMGVEKNRIENLQVEAQEKNIKLRISADPFKGMDVLEEGASAYHAETVTPGPVPGHVVDVISEPAPVVRPSSRSVKKLLPLEALLRQADIAPSSEIRAVDEGPDSEAVAYQWELDQIFASAEQRPLKDEGQFEGYVKDYLERTQSRCPKADFAIVPDDSVQKGPVRADSYEIACVGEGVSSSAALLFFSKDGNFTVIAHESSTENMGAAINVRDRLLKEVVGS